MSNERVERLEERIAWLERHLTEQDKVMLELGDSLRALQREIAILRLRGGGGSSEGDALPVDERPPHY